MSVRQVELVPTATESSLYTTTSSSTQWGPGALSGKAIRAMGKAVIRGVEYLAIKRRLAAIKAASPFSLEVKDDQHALFQGMSDDLLELARTGLYPETFRDLAVRLIIAQIAQGQTSYLLCSLSKWDVDSEVVATFLSEIIGVIFFCHRGFANEDFVKAYRA
ncbi:hypothetical protein R3P38DRAFT_3593012, partial [Favolaschia claudopus]